MKRLIFLIAVLFLCSTIQANAAAISAVCGGARVIAAGAKNITADFWMTFESNSDCTVTELDKSDGVAGAHWDDLVDTQSKMNCVSTSATKNLTSTVNSTTVTGTKGLAIDYSATATTAVKYYFPASTNSFSIGFWYYTPTQQNYNNVALFYAINSDSAVFATLYGDVGADGGGSTKIKFGTSTSYITVTTATWYWVTAQFVKNSTCTINIYTDDIGTSLVGTTSFSATDFAFIGINLGTAAYSVATTGYYDNILMDTINATFPLIGE
jgi:hypothetical protein